jgi:hypothetical protein
MYRSLEGHYEVVFSGYLKEEESKTSCACSRFVTTANTIIAFTLSTINNDNNNNDNTTIPKTTALMQFSLSFHRHEFVGGAIPAAASASL